MLGQWVYIGSLKIVSLIIQSATILKKIKLIIDLDSVFSTLSKSAGIY